MIKKACATLELSRATVFRLLARYLLGHASVQTTERYIGSKQKLQDAVNDRLGISIAGETA